MKHATLPSSKRTRSGGFTLIEVLVSLLILAFGILGMATLQLNALKLNQTSADRSQASVLAADVADRMRANRKNARAGDYDISIGENASAGASIAATDLRQWKESLQSQLPNGDGEIARNGDVFRITVQWDESRVGGDEVQEFVFETGL